VESWNGIENKAFSTTYKKRGIGMNLNLDDSSIVPDDGKLAKFLITRRRKENGNKKIHNIRGC
jgi:hypothetical protein